MAGDVSPVAMFIPCFIIVILQVAITIWRSLVLFGNFANSIMRLPIVQFGGTRKGG